MKHTFFPHPHLSTTRLGFSVIFALALLAPLSLLTLPGCSDDSAIVHDARLDGHEDLATRRDGLLADQNGHEDARGDLTGDHGTDDLSAPYTLRIMSANLTSGSTQSYTPGHGARIITAFHPDVVLIQEMNYGNKSPEDIATFVTRTLGPEYTYFRERGAIPNGIISRYPIIASGEWDDIEVSNRDFAWAQIDLPGPRDLWAVSIHLLTSKPGERNREANALVTYLEAHVPAGSLLILGGDFNTKSRSEGCVDALRKRLTIQKTYPADQDDNDNTNAKRNSPYDWLLASPTLHALEVPLKVGSASFPHGLVFDSRVYTPLADLPSVLKTDSDASQMQHMAVIRQFQISP